MKIKTSEATPRQLDYMVAQCNLGGKRTNHGQPYFKYEKSGHVFFHPHENGWRDSQMFLYLPSAMWSQGGPIIEREGITLVHMGVDWHDSWKARMGDGHWQGHEIHGPTPLVAAMRCYVTSKLGAEVEIPEELKP